MFKSEKKRLQLIQDVENKINKWDERSCFVISGVRNLSRSDLDTIVMYAELSGTNQFMRPVGGVGEVLEKYGYVHN